MLLGHLNPVTQGLLLMYCYLAISVSHMFCYRFLLLWGGSVYPLHKYKLNPKDLCLTGIHAACPSSHFHCTTVKTLVVVATYSVPPSQNALSTTELAPACALINIVAWIYQQQISTLHTTG